MTDQQTQDPYVGRTLAGTYLITERIGAGGMGVLYKATNQQLDQTVTLKMLNRSLDSASAKRFMLEAKTLAMLVHPNIVAIKSLHVDESGDFFFVMEYLQGQDLSAFLKEHGPLSLDQFKSIFAQICDGLSFAHSKNILHRDLKPSNIMLLSRDDGTFTAKILDFGLAKFTEQTRSQSLTESGTVFGSPNYMSPEQCSGGKVDERSDIYSLACMMHESLTGATPFAAESAVQIIYRHMNETLPPLETQSLAALSSVLQRASAIIPADRFQSVTELWAAITANKGVRIDNVLGGGKPAAKKRMPVQFVFAIAMVSVAVLTVLAVTTLHASSIVGRVNEALHLGDEGKWTQMCAELDKLKTDGSMPSSLAESVRDRCYKFAMQAKQGSDERQAVSNRFIDYGILQIKLLRKDDQSRPTAQQALQLLNLMNALGRYDREIEVINQEFQFEQFDQTGSDKNRIGQLHLRRADLSVGKLPADTVGDYEIALQCAKDDLHDRPRREAAAAVTRITDTLAAIYNSSGQYKKAIALVNDYYRVMGEYEAADIARAQDSGADSTAQMEIHLGNAYKGLGDVANTYDHFGHARDIATNALEEPDQLTPAQISRLNKQLLTASDHLK